MATFIQIDSRAGLLVLIASVIVAWALLSPESMRATVDSATAMIQSMFQTAASTGMVTA